MNHVMKEAMGISRRFIFYNRHSSQENIEKY